MSDDKKVARRSMVGAPPSGKGTPARTSGRTPRASSARMKMKEEAEEEEKEQSEHEESGHDSGEEGDDDGAKPAKRAKRRPKSKLLTDSAAKSKRRAEKKAKEEEAKKKAIEQGLIEEEEEEEPVPSPPVESPEPEMRAPTLGKYSPFQLMCDYMLRKLMNKDPDEYFAFPVTQSQAPDYHTVIATPMDFATMRDKIESDAYDSIAEMRTDAELIVTNALAYNHPNTVYHFAASKLAAITKFYFSEQHLRYVFHTLPFANQVPLEKAGLTPLAPVAKPRADNKRRLPLTDDLTPEALAAGADPAVRPRLAKRGPNDGAKLAFIDNRDGATVLNVIGEETDKSKLRLIDLVGGLDEGTPGMYPPVEHKLSSARPITYLNYGPFASFAPQFDSTWATLSKRDSDLLLRTYGDRGTATDALSLRQLVADSGQHFITIVDDLLDTLTEGEHARCITALENPDKAAGSEPSLDELLSEVESLDNLGLDVSFVAEVRAKMGVAPPCGIQAQLDATGRAVLDLAHLQQRRLSQAPPMPLNRAPPPGPLEQRAAASVANQLAATAAEWTQPGQVVQPPAVRDALALDDDILSEFFV